MRQMGKREVPERWHSAQECELRNLVSRGVIEENMRNQRRRWVELVEKKRGNTERGLNRAEVENAHLRESTHADVNNGGRNEESNALVIVACVSVCETETRVSHKSGTRLYVFT